MDHQSRSQFWKACGATGPLEVQPEAALEIGAVPGDVPGGRAVPYPFAVIGRDSKADVRLEHKDISQHHVYIQVIDGRVFWIDLGSRSGTSQDDVIVPSGWLEPGDAIGVGPFLVRARVGAGWATTVGPNPLADRGPESWPDAVLEFPDRPEGSGRWKLGRVLTLVGRATDCRLKIPDDDISRFHCALLRTPAGPWVVDLLSREGTRVAGARVRAAPLKDGAQLHVGRYRMIVRLVDPSRPDSGEFRAASVSPRPRDQLPVVARPSSPPAPTSPRTVEGTIIQSSPMAVQSFDLERFVDRLELMQTEMFEQFHQAMMTMFQAFGAMQRDQMSQVRDELDRIRELTGELQALQSGKVSQTREESTAEAPPDLPLPPPPSSAAATPAEAPERDHDRPTGPLPRKPNDRLAGIADQDLHEQITRRITEIQGERQGRWKRVLEMISGNNGG